MKQDLIVSFSGGRTSAYMCYILLRDPEFLSIFNYHFIFANTGKEREETLLFVDQCDKHFGLNLTWVEAKVNPEDGKGTKYTVVDFKTASRKGEPFEEVIKKYGIPNQKFPHCTRELKQRPIHAYAKENISADYKTAIGIRIDEARRALNDEKIVYPLLRQDLWIGSQGIIEFWKQMPFDLQLKHYEGNCDLCWKKSAKKKIQLIKDNPSIANWWVEMENKYSEGEYHFHRSNESTLDLISRAVSNQLELSTDNDEMACACRESLAAA